jgi:hypothetical protein
MKYYLIVGLVFASFGLKCTDLSVDAMTRASYYCKEREEAGVRCIYIASSGTSKADCSFIVWLTDDCCLRLPEHMASRFVGTSQRDPLVSKISHIFDVYNYSASIKKRTQSAWLSFVAKLIVLKTPWFGSRVVSFTQGDLRNFIDCKLSFPSPEALERVALALFSEEGIRTLLRVERKLNFLEIMKLYCTEFDKAIVKECDLFFPNEKIQLLGLSRTELFAVYPLTVSRYFELYLYEGTLAEKIDAFKILVTLAEEQSTSNLHSSLQSLDVIVRWIISQSYTAISYFPSVDSRSSSDFSSLDTHSFSSDVSGEFLSVQTNKDLSAELAQVYYDRLNVLSVFFNLDVPEKKRCWARIFRRLIPAYKESVEVHTALERFVHEYGLPEEAAEVAIGKPRWCCC